MSRHFTSDKALPRLLQLAEGGEAGYTRAATSPAGFLERYSMEECCESTSEFFADRTSYRRSVHRAGDLFASGAAIHTAGDKPSRRQCAGTFQRRDSRGKHVVSLRPDRA